MSMDFPTSHTFKKIHLKVNELILSVQFICVFEGILSKFNQPRKILTQVLTEKEFLLS